MTDKREKVMVRFRVDFDIRHRFKKLCEKMGTTPYLYLQKHVEDLVRKFDE